METVTDACRDNKHEQCPVTFPCECPCHFMSTPEHPAEEAAHVMPSGAPSGPVYCPDCGREQTPEEVDLGYCLSTSCGGE